jgi:hypothetical protein
MPPVCHSIVAPVMRAITVIRAVAWIGVVVAGWSMNLVWGPDPAVGKGPPAHWERWVVGATLLGVIAAMVLSIAGRKEQPPSWRSRGVALAAALSGIAIALLLLRNARASGFAHLIAGDGWPWLAAGTGVTLAAAIAALFLRPAQRVSRKSRGRKRAAGR